MCPNRAHFQFHQFSKKRVEKILEDPDFRNRDRILRRDTCDYEKNIKYPGRFVSLTCRCLLDGLISRGTFAKYLDIDRDDIDDKLAEFGFFEDNYKKIKDGIKELNHEKIAFA